MKRYIAAAAILFLGALFVWAPWSPTAEDLGARAAAKDALVGRFAFHWGGGFTEHGSFLGTPNCLVPPENDVRVTDTNYSQAEEKRVDQADKFATAYNQYLIEHYPKPAAAICRH